jgi:hypothetical protein
MSCSTSSRRTASTAPISCPSPKKSSSNRYSDRGCYCEFCQASWAAAKGKSSMRLGGKLCCLKRCYGILGSIRLTGRSSFRRKTANKWLLATMRETKRPVVLYTHGRAYFATHMIALVGALPSKGTYFVYDPRHQFSYKKTGTESSSVPDIPIGNRKMTRAELLREWRGPASVGLMNSLVWQLQVEGIYNGSTYHPPLARYQAIVLR